MKNQKVISDFPVRRPNVNELTKSLMNAIKNKLTEESSIKTILLDRKDPSNKYIPFINIRFSHSKKSSDILFTFSVNIKVNKKSTEKYLSSVTKNIYKILINISFPYGILMNKSPIVLNMENGEIVIRGTLRYSDEIYSHQRIQTCSFSDRCSAPICPLDLQIKNMSYNKGDKLCPYLSGKILYKDIPSHIRKTIESNKNILERKCKITLFGNSKHNMGKNKKEKVRKHYENS